MLLRQSDLLYSDDWWKLWRWLTPQFMQQVEWKHLYAWWWWLAAVALVLAVVVAIVRKEKYVYSLPGYSYWKEEHKPAAALWLMHKLSAFCILPAAFFFLLALARPQKQQVLTEQETEGISIVLALDVSASMQLKDFTPNRLAVMKALAKDFVRGRHTDAIGLVVFAGDAFTLSPLTTDYEQLVQRIDEISFATIRKRGTALGTAIAVGVNRLKESKTKSRVLLVLSDGDNTAGTLEPEAAALIAKEFGIKIYSILIGKEGQILKGKDAFGQAVYVNNTVEPAVMQSIARITGGRYYRAEDQQALRQIFREIDKQEKAPIKVKRKKIVVEYYAIYLRWALLCWLLWYALRLGAWRSWLSD
ncbi:VWA domain-containing protein [Thermonema rossianum]|uniref:VWA domain-containing protein n=1 Tax=Thermonema rossianum TaxID=55505 RepID=UPI000691BF17|nr:VWA domain-containing protein [Thermonema rossianum]